jgi:hypothetical protein
MKDKKDNLDQQKSVSGTPASSGASDAARAMQAIALYARIARPIMLQYLRRNSCIAATRITQGVLQKFDINVRPYARKWVVEVPSRRLVYLAGFRGDEKVAMRKKSSDWIDRCDQAGQGWEGHVIGVANNRWLIDASFDQCQSIHHGFEVPPTILVVDLRDFGQAWSPQSVFDAKLSTDAGIGVNVQYIPMEGGEDEYATSEAWRDGGLRLIERRIITAMLRSPAMPERADDTASPRAASESPELARDLQVDPKKEGTS